MEKPFDTADGFFFAYQLDRLVAPFDYICSMKKLIVTTVFVLFCLSSKAQSLQIEDLSSSVGYWKGKLTYLDYSSGKPYSMSANIKISLTEDKSGFIMGYEYPDEPHANSLDTTYVNGKLFGKDRIVEFNKTSEGGFTFITETEGEDGNDQKKAILRHTYIVKANTFSAVKDVKFEGTDKWIKRNEYLLNRGEN